MEKYKLMFDFLRRNRQFKSKLSLLRHFSKTTPQTAKDPLAPPGFCMKGSAAGLLVGVYSKNDGRHDSATYTKEAEKYDKRICGTLNKLLRITGPCPRVGEVRVFYGLEPEFAAVGVVGLGHRCDAYNDVELIDQSKENTRVAAGAGVRAMSKIGLSKLFIESFSNLEAAAEGATLGLWRYQEKKNRNAIPSPVLEPYGDCDLKLWEIGSLKAEAQNLTRQLAETPANIITPVRFAHKTVEILSGTGVCVEVRQRDWAIRQGMGGFLAAASGSCEQPIFLELWYCGTGDDRQAPVALLGAGCTFDTGGIQLIKNYPHHPWGTDMTAAASIVSTFKAIAALKLPVNVRGLIPLCENMPGGYGSMRPGDIVRAHNDKNILIQSTKNAAATRLMLADALAYAHCYCPTYIVDVANVSHGKTGDALSTAATGVFSNSEKLWDHIQLASIHTGDRVWRLPLFKHYGLKLTKEESVDVLSHGSHGTTRRWGGGPCIAASFLREFVPCNAAGWMHIDISATSFSDGITDPIYLDRGLTGRPTRTIIEFLCQFSASLKASLNSSCPS